MCVHVRICLLMFQGACVYVFMFVGMCKCAWVSMCDRMCLYLHVHVSVFVSVCVCVRMCICA